MSIVLATSPQPKSFTRLHRLQLNRLRKSCSDAYVHLSMLSFYAFFTVQHVSNSYRPILSLVHSFVSGSFEHWLFIGSNTNYSRVLSPTFVFIDHSSFGIISINRI